ncbi:MAG: ATP-dependent DNA ligase [Nitrososphaerales archaeon]
MSEFSKFAIVCDSIKATRSKLEKIRILSEYFSSLRDQDLKIAATFLSGRVFSPGEVEQEANVGYSTLWSVISKITGLDGKEISKYYLKHGDLGSVFEEILSGKTSSGQQVLGASFRDPLSLERVQASFLELSRAVGRNSQDRKKQILLGLFSSVEIPSEAKYIVKILTNEMRIGLVEGLVEESIAKAFSKTLAEVRMANLVAANVGYVAIKARNNELDLVKLVPLNPTNFMLADNAETAELAFKKFRAMPVYSEFKYDGIRAQMHLAQGAIKLFSRNLADITRFFPELIEDAAHLNQKNLILDGEIIASKGDDPLSFQLLQRRLRKLARTGDDVPIKYIVFDVLFCNDSPLIEEPLLERVKILKELELRGKMALSEQKQVSSPEEIFAMFQSSKSKGFEGLVVKSPSSPYTPGRRGSNWVKLKKELETLDVVIVAAEYGHGKRAGVISDYTFAVKDDDELKVIGKAYSGLSDAEITEMTKLIETITIQDQGYRMIVKPSLLIEVAFDAIQKSERHDSGYALRFPRIKRLRFDKSPKEIDTLERVKKIYESQRVKA